MMRQVIQDAPAPPPVLMMRTPVNWTAVICVGLLGAIHLAVSLPAFWIGRWEGFLSLGLGVLFVLLAGAIRLARIELRVVPENRLVIQRAVLLRTWYESKTPFGEVRGVRLTLLPGPGDESRIELLCGRFDIECPATPVPRQQALLLAMTLNVPLERVSEADDEQPAPPLDDRLPQTARTPREL